MCNVETHIMSVLKSTEWNSDLPSTDFKAKLLLNFAI